VRVMHSIKMDGVPSNFSIASKNDVRHFEN
jgi:hypothetical protein